MVSSLRKTAGGNPAAWASFKIARIDHSGWKFAREQHVALEAIPASPEGWSQIEQALGTVSTVKPGTSAPARGQRGRQPLLNQDLHGPTRQDGQVHGLQAGIL
jgi:hypothetical protein